MQGYKKQQTIFCGVPKRQPENFGCSGILLKTSPGGGGWAAENIEASKIASLELDFSNVTFSTDGNVGLFIWHSTKIMRVAKNRTCVPHWEAPSELWRPPTHPPRS